MKLADKEELEKNKREERLKRQKEAREEWYMVWKMTQCRISQKEEKRKKEEGGTDRQKDSYRTRCRRHGHEDGAD